MKKILMPILEAGAGHRMPALAVKAAIEAKRPGKYQIDVIDFAAVAGAKAADKRMKSFWDHCLGHPAYARFMYAIMEIFRPIARLVLPVAFADFVRIGREYIKNYQPDLVFATHYFTQSVAARARDALKLKIKVIGFDTDPFDAFTFWCDKRLDTLILASETARLRALAHGMKREQLCVFPFPVNAQFFKIENNRNQILSSLGLDPKRTTILTSMGGQGIGSVSNYIRQICEKNLPYNVIAVCGRNEAMRAELETFKKGMESKTTLVALGFVNNMNELLCASDLLIAKAGASTTFEALFMKVPTIFTSYAIQSERPNVEFCVANKSGWYAPDEKSFWKVMDRVEKTGILAEYRGNLEKLGLSSGSDAIADYLLKELEGPAAT